MIRIRRSRTTRYGVWLNGRLGSWRWQISVGCWTPRIPRRRLLAARGLLIATCQPLGEFVVYQTTTTPKGITA